METKRLNVRMPVDLHARFKQVAKSEGVDMSDAVRDAIAQWLEKRGHVVEDVQLGERFGRPAPAASEAGEA